MGAYEHPYTSLLCYERQNITSCLCEEEIIGGTRNPVINVVADYFFEGFDDNDIAAYTEIVPLCRPSSTHLTFSR